jgi:hypothetical protein
MIGSHAEIIPNESSFAWLWISMIVISASALIVGGLYFYHQKRGLNPPFNINVSFRNNGVVSDFTNSFTKSPTNSPFTHQLPKVMNLLPKGFEWSKNTSITS